MTTRDLFGSIEQALFALRVPAVPTEYDLHRMIAAALADGGFVVRHEVTLSPRCRIDFLVDDIGIEVKKGRPGREALIRQAERYLAQPQLKGLLLVVERSVSVPSMLCGKPVRVCGLNRLWGVALP